MQVSSNAVELVRFASKPNRILGIMQPYFLPFFEQFRLIAACDLWIVFDTPQYVRKSWINRNRIINLDKGWTYLSFPVKHAGLDVAIRESEVDESQNWRGVVMDKLRVYEKEAPNYSKVRGLIETSLATEFRSVAELNERLLRAITSYLGISTPILNMESLALDLPENCAAGEWALHISKALGANEYRNAAGGTALFDRTLYEQAGIKLSFHEHIHMTYATGRFQFVENLSVIDYLMWNDLQQLQEWLPHRST